MARPRGADPPSLTSAAKVVTGASPAPSLRRPHRPLPLARRATTLNILSLTASPLSVIPAAPSALPVSVPVAALRRYPPSPPLSTASRPAGELRHSRVGADSRPALRTGPLRRLRPTRFASARLRTDLRPTPRSAAQVTLVQSGLGQSDRPARLRNRRAFGPEAPR